LGFWGFGILGVMDGWMLVFEFGDFLQFGDLGFWDLGNWDLRFCKATPH
jgi:hypothetical protein